MISGQHGHAVSSLESRHAVSGSNSNTSRNQNGTFAVFLVFGLILLILFFFSMALFFDWKADRLLFIDLLLMIVGISRSLESTAQI